jgi:hypothetical protein
MTNTLDIEDRKTDFATIQKETFRTELGLRAISFMYDDHSDDKDSYENILKLKDNIQYRLFSATHQYLVLLRELGSAEAYLQKLYKENPNYINAFPFGNPYFDQVELELSSVFDNIIFQLSSTFDYLSHIVCYITFKNKSNTVYWTKLAKTARGDNNELSELQIRETIDKLDRRFVGRLYDYRSRLLHHKRDKHEFGGVTNLPDFKFKIQMEPSAISLKHFDLIKEETKDLKFTLTYLSSWLIKRSFVEIEAILDALEPEIKKNTNFYKNVGQPKRKNGLNIVSLNKETNAIEPSSDGFWKEYKSKASR